MNKACSIEIELFIKLPLRFFNAIQLHDFEKSLNKAKFLGKLFKLLMEISLSAVNAKKSNQIGKNCDRDRPEQ